MSRIIKSLESAVAYAKGDKTKGQSTTVRAPDDLLDRMRRMIADLDLQAEHVSNLRKPRQDNDFGRTAALMEEAMNHIIWLRARSR
jgi:hypothetical protein